MEAASRGDIGGVFNAGVTATREAGAAIGAAAGLSYTKDLPDRDILKVLAFCASAVYNLEVKPGLVELAHSQKESITSATVLQYGIYRITSKEHHGEKVLALRGTYSLKSAVQDVPIALGGFLAQEVFLNSVRWASKAARDHGVQWVCGHSLGGALAEAVCADIGVGGGAFNAPAVWAPGSNSLIKGSSYKDKPFEVHLTESDPVCSFSVSGTPPNSAHIGTPKWHHHGGMHDMEKLYADICQH